MLVVGLTGSIGMGKSSVAEMFRQLKAPVYDADAEVHKLYAEGGAAVEPIRAQFPEAVVDNKVDRARLSKLVLGNDTEIRKLEAITHPLLGQGRAVFLPRQSSREQKLLFWTCRLFSRLAAKRISIRLSWSARQKKYRGCAFWTGMA